jgi:transcriptional regulator with XRE-family HTH domain
MDGKTLKKWRLDTGLSQQDVAELLAVGIATIRRWEADATAPSDRNLARLERLMREIVPEESTQRETVFGGPSFGKSAVAKELLDSLAIRDTVRQSRAEHLSRFEKDRVLPYPRNSVERRRVEQGTIAGGVDRVLVEKFEEERTARGLTDSKMLETILWHYFDRPALSFQLNRSPGEDAGTDDHHEAKVVDTESKEENPTDF